MKRPALVENPDFPRFICLEDGGFHEVNNVRKVDVSVSPTRNSLLLVAE
jgi:hypothetical protein